MPAFPLKVGVPFPIGSLESAGYPSRQPICVHLRLKFPSASIGGRGQNQLEVRDASKGQPKSRLDRSYLQARPLTAHRFSSGQFHLLFSLDIRLSTVETGHKNV